MRFEIAHLVIFTFLCLSLGQGLAYEDNDLTCPGTEHISGLTRRAGVKDKHTSHRCSRFVPKLSQAPSCSKGPAFKCNGDFEGCNDPNAWIGGFQVFDMGGRVDVLVPYCCTSPQVEVKNGKCRQGTLAASGLANVNYGIPPSRVIYRFSCEYTKAVVGQKPNGMKMSAEDCAYDVNRRQH